MHVELKSFFQQSRFFRPFRMASVVPSKVFEVTEVGLDRRCAEVERAWGQLLLLESGPEKIFQTPAYIDHVSETCLAGERAGLFIIRGIDKGIVGIIPARKYIQEVCFRLGDICLFKQNVRGLQLLGSVPLLYPHEHGLPSFAIKHLLQRFPECQALVMQAMPINVIEKYKNIRSLSCHILYGWRDCHVCLLPDTVDKYLKSFNAKKRYNLSRQIRLLGQNVGKIQLVRITEALQVPELIEAIESIPAARRHLNGNLKEQLVSLAKNRLMLSYLLRCREENVALILGVQSEQAWHIFNICFNEKYSRFSIGTSALHLAQQDVIQHLLIRRVDFGYGTPGHDHRSSHSLEKRGKLLVCRTFSCVNFILKAHGLFEAVNQCLCKGIKRIRKTYRSVVKTRSLEG